MDFLRVRGWDRWQSYRKDRGQPPWIKVYRALLKDWDFCSLSAADRGHLVSIWLLAAERNGRIPDDANAIKQLCSLSETPPLDLFLSLQFLEKEGKRRRRRDASVTPQYRSSTETDLTPPLDPPPSGGDGESPRRKRFVKPTLDEVRAYCAERRNNVDPEVWIDHYISNGWRVGKNPMKDWKAAVRTWERNAHGGRSNGQRDDDPWSTAR